jgi:dTDP-4-amino-4,6-dideoxygalactose transaminase
MAVALDCAVMSRGFVTPSAPLVETSVPFAPPANAAEEIAGVVATLLAAAVGQGHEVVTTPLTFCATANVVVVHTGATPVFADIDRETFNLDPLAAHAAMAPRTRAISRTPPPSFYQERFGLRRGMFPAADAVSDSTLSLPLSAGMTTEAVGRVIEALHDVLG